ncbi:phage gp6-like head-tail connector protein [Nocardiopsis gilva YIM 90087]|uniref:Phage gp6-like head-tail connector protein n=1 Tax=Nocardiopsis gilva YIM 90087 TaxID=1235441 RepID=A0A223S655_9ACTN|nr:phage gp6-like head-tail connector protein [Nocardiopsis gilva]ASU83578.1 phage gp6-like head-tail connector protein [Nocardiopsis gilva YIM 90087]
MPALTLAAAKKQLNITSTTHDTELQDYVDGVNEVVEFYVGPVDDRTVVERWTGARRAIAVRHRPVVSLTSVTYLVDGSEVAAVADVDVDIELGVLRLKTAEWWPEGRYLVEYVAGRGGSAPAAADIAGRIIIQHLWETQRGGDSRRPDLAGGLETVTTGGFTFSVPRRAIQLLEAHSTGPAFA